MHGEQFRITLDLPPMAVMFFKIKDKRTPPSQLTAAEEVPETVQEEVPAEEAVPVALPLLNEDRPVADVPEGKPADKAQEAPVIPAKPAEKTPETTEKPEKTANPAKKGDNPNKITAHKVGTGGNI